MSRAPQHQEEAAEVVWTSDQEATENTLDGLYCISHLGRMQGKGGPGLPGLQENAA